MRVFFFRPYDFISEYRICVTEMPSTGWTMNQWKCFWCKFRIWKKNKRRRNFFRWLCMIWTSIWCTVHRIWHHNEKLKSRVIWRGFFSSLSMMCILPRPRPTNSVFFLYFFSFVFRFLLLLFHATQMGDDMQLGQTEVCSDTKPPTGLSNHRHSHTHSNAHNHGINNHQHLHGVLIGSMQGYGNNLIETFKTESLCQVQCMDCQKVKRLRPPEC